VERSLSSIHHHRNRERIQVSYSSFYTYSHFIPLGKKFSFKEDRTMNFRIFATVVAVMAFTAATVSGTPVPVPEPGEDMTCGEGCAN
jgi:hypothetical protein